MTYVGTVRGYKGYCDECEAGTEEPIIMLHQNLYCAPCLKRAYDMAQDAERTPRPSAKR